MANDVLNHLTFWQQPFSENNKDINKLSNEFHSKLKVRAN